MTDAYPGDGPVTIISWSGQWSNDGRTWHHYNDRDAPCGTCGKVHRLTDAKD